METAVFIILAFTSNGTPAIVPAGYDTPTHSYEECIGRALELQHFQYDKHYNYSCVSPTQFVPPPQVENAGK